MEKNKKYLVFERKLMTIAQSGSGGQKTFVKKLMPGYFLYSHSKFKKKKSNKKKIQSSFELEVYWTDSLAQLYENTSKKKVFHD